MDLTEINSRSDIPIWLKSENLKIIAEIGVRNGNHLKSLLKASPEKLIVIDIWDDDGILAHNDVKYSTEQLKICADTVLKLSTQYQCIDIRLGYSSDVVKKFDDGFFDFIYIDADHTYDGVMQDMVNWWPKIKQGGVMGGHDYTLRKNAHGLIFGVVQAVHEFIGINNLRPNFHCTWPNEAYGNWFIRK